MQRAHHASTQHQVMPAQAGIHCVRGLCRFDVLAPRPEWAPTFVGVTDWGAGHGVRARPSRFDSKQVVQRGHHASTQNQVMPAQAGTHCVRMLCRFDVLAPCPEWAPTFVGVTDWGATPQRKRPHLPMRPFAWSEAPLPA